MMSAQPPAHALHGECQLSVAMRMIAWRMALVGGMFYLASPKCGEAFWTSCHFFNAHDAFMIMLLALALLALSFWTPGKRWPLSLSPRRLLWVGLLCVGVFACGALGRTLVFGGFDLSRDEVMAVFDAEVFSAGRLFSALPTQWRYFQWVAQPQFMAPITGGEHVISAYLPVHAALRALISLVADPLFLNPLLAAAAVAMVYDLARQMWPQRPDAAFVAALLLATSSQLLITSMTSYAMTAHLFFNLLWLRFFLRGGTLGHAGALTLGFFACGLHQVVFHPLFAAPFILRLLTRRRFLGLCYASSYLMMIAFWGSYLRLAMLWDGHAPPAGAGAGDMGLTYLFVRVSEMLADFDFFGGIVLIVLNLLRFVAWQSLLLIPLCLLAWRAVRDDEGVMRELVAGLALTLFAMFVLMPYQGFGWGYRYWHGLLGSSCLLGACGWIKATQSTTPLASRIATSALAITSAFSILIALPLHAHHAAALNAPMMAARRAIEAAPVDIVLVDENRVRWGVDLVRNDPGLQVRPMTLFFLLLEPEHLESLCGRYRLALFGGEHVSRFGMLAGPEVLPQRSARMREKLASLNCAPLME